MNTKELRVARIVSGLSQDDVASCLKRSRVAYNMKETGKRDFSISEVKVLVGLLDLNMADVNKIFFDDIVPIGKS